MVNYDKIRQLITDYKTLAAEEGAAQISQMRTLRAKLYEICTELDNILLDPQSIDISAFLTDTSVVDRSKSYLGGL